MEISLEAIAGVIVALAMSVVAILKLRKAPDQPDSPAPGEPPAVPGGQDIGTVEVLGLFADANGEMIWNYLDPSRHTLFVRLRGLKKGPIRVGLEVDGRVDDIRTLTIGENTSVDKIHSFAMEFPKYDRYRSTGRHQISVLTGYAPDDPRAAPVWTARTDYQVEVVQR